MAIVQNHLLIRHPETALIQKGYQRMHEDVDQVSISHDVMCALTGYAAP